MSLSSLHLSWFIQHNTRCSILARFWTVLNIMGTALWFMIVWSTFILDFKTRAFLLLVHDQPKIRMIFRYFSALHASTLSLFTVDLTDWVFPLQAQCPLSLLDFAFIGFFPCLQTTKAILDSESITWCWFLMSAIPTWWSHVALVRYALFFTTASLKIPSHFQQWPY